MITKSYGPKVGQSLAREVYNANSLGTEGRFHGRRDCGAD